MGRLRISEVFVSRQGEGGLAGTDSFFVRTSGCNLRCWFCDTPYASWRPENETASVERLVERAIESGLRHAVITGGEPLLQPAVGPLTRALSDAGLHVTIETAGTVDRPVHCDLASISPKLSGSGPRLDQRSAAHWQHRHEEVRWRPDVIAALAERSADYQIKFVVDRPEEFAEVELAVAALAWVSRDRVWVMPQAVDVVQLEEQGSWLRERANAAGFRYCDRLHLRWYGNRRGT